MVQRPTTLGDLQWAELRCAYCYGTGIHHDRSGHRRNLSCQVCLGKGVVVVRTPAQRCLRYRGTGRDQASAFGLPCTTCAGKGGVPREWTEERSRAP